MSDFNDMLIQLRTELANLRIRETQIIATIQALERLVGQGTVTLEIDPKNPTPFRGVTLGDACQQIITQNGPLGTADLAELLLRGGAKTRARNFVATLYSLLYKDGRFVLKDHKWHLRSPRESEAA